MTLGIQVRNVSMRYSDEVLALDDVSFDLEGGKIYGLLGRNGAGKSTLLAIMAAFRKPTSGEVLVNGQPVWENPDITRQICLIRERADTVEGSEPVKAALSFAAAMRPNWDDDYAWQLVEKFEIPERDKIDHLSRGKRAALSIVLGLASRAPVTIFDEPYVGMDAPSRYLFYEELLNDFMAHPRTVIVSTHLIEEIASLFEEILIIDRGKLLLHEESDALRSRGAAVTGRAEDVDRLVAGLTVLSEKRLGPTKSVAVYGQLDSELRRRAEADGLELEPLPLQDLFVHLTRRVEGAAR